MRHSYKGFVIDIRTNELPDRSGWRSLVSIEKHLGSHVDVLPTMPAPGIFKSELEAQEAGIKFGQNKIDEM